MKKLILFCFVFLSCGLFGQTIQLGSGTTESSNYNSSPVNVWYRSTVCEFVYTASELSSAGASTTSAMTEIGFYVTEVPVYTLPNYTIQMKHTTQSDVSSGLGSTGWTTIKNAFSYSPTAGGFDMIVLDNGFTWDGSNNIAIRICWDRTTWYNPTGKVRTYPTANGYRYRLTDSFNLCGSDPTTISTDKPQIQMVFIVGTETTWTGTASTDWHDGSNWTTGVPSANMDVVIPSAPGNQPTISADAFAQNISIESGATLSVSGANTLSVSADWTNDGSFVCSDGQLRFFGTDAALINGGTQTFNDLQIDNIGGATLQSGSYLIQGILSLNGGTFSSNGRIELESNASNTAMIGEIRTPCAYSLIMNDSFGDGWNGAFITLYVDGEAVGNYSASGSGTTETIYIPYGLSFDIEYTSGIYENENTYSLDDPFGTTVFSDGTSPSTGVVYTGSGNCSFINPMSGDFTLNRYIDAGLTNWRFFSFPVNGEQLEEIDDDLITTGPLGSDFPGWIPPSWSTVFYSLEYYDESVSGSGDLGFTGYTNMTYNPQPGEGMRIWSGDSYVNTDAFSLDWTGSPNAGDYDLPVSYTNSGDSDSDGWCLVGNPYFCTIDWDDSDWVKSSNISDAIYIWDADLNTYATYIGGVGTNGGSQYIAPGQAFFVKVSASSPSPQLTVSEQCKYENDVAFRNQVADIIRFRICGDNACDESVLRFSENASFGFDQNYDAQKLSADFWNAPQISQGFEGENYSINSIPYLTESIVIPLNCQSNYSQNYNLEIVGIEDFGEDYCIVLEDVMLGEYIHLVSDTSYAFDMEDALLENRFNLLIFPSPQSSTVDISCFGLTDGQIFIESPMESDFVWTNDQGEILQTTSGQSNDQLSGLAAGTYQVQVDHFATCPSSLESIVIAEPDPIAVEIEANDATCDWCCDGSIILDITGGSPPYFVNWENGNTPPQSFVEDLCQGIYAFVLEDINGCQQYGQGIIGNLTSVGSINVDDLKIYPNPSNSILNIRLPWNEITNMQVFDVSGKLVFDEQLQQQYQLNVLDWQKGIYVIQFSNNKLGILTRSFVVD